MKFLLAIPFLLAAAMAQTVFTCEQPVVVSCKVSAVGSTSTSTVTNTAPPAQFTILQTKSTSVVSGNSAVVKLSNPTTAGSHLLAIITDYYGKSTFRVSDNQGHSFQQDFSATGPLCSGCSNVGNTVGTSAYLGTNVGSGHEVTVTSSGSQDYFLVSVVEVRGLPTSNWFQAAGPYSGGQATANFSASVKTDTTPSVVIGVAHAWSNATAQGNSTNWTNIESYADAYHRIFIQEQPEATPDTITFSGKLSAPSSVSAVAAAYRVGN